MSNAIVAQPTAAPKIRPYRPSPSRARTLNAPLRRLDHFIVANKKLETARLALAEAAFSGNAKAEAQAKRQHERAYQTHKRVLLAL